MQHYLDGVMFARLDGRIHFQMDNLRRRSVSSPDKTAWRKISWEKGGRLWADRHFRMIGCWRTP